MGSRSNLGRLVLKVGSSGKTGTVIGNGILKVPLVSAAPTMGARLVGKITGYEGHF